uniref:Long-chain-fatty-acid--CoA ligase n=1 Tax=Takifugu rubripes TaxID=31033 RepID=A0A674MBH8_TAKRU
MDFVCRLGLPSLDSVSQYIRSISTPVWVGTGVVAAATTYLLTSRPTAPPPICDLNLQSIEIPGGELARKSVLQKGDAYLKCYYDDAKTMYESFLRGCRVSNDGPCLGSRKPKQSYEWLSYSQVKERAENLGSAFLHKGHSKSNRPHIGIFSQNRPEWTLGELACYTYSLVSVPLYDTLGTEAIVYIIEKASISTIMCDVGSKVELILSSLEGRKHPVRNIVLMEKPPVELITRAEQCGIDVTSMEGMEALGKAHHQEPVPPQPEDMAVICFTSGTTGNPKGARLTHENIVSNCSGVIKTTEVSSSLTSRGSDTHMSYLPLAHMFERVVQGVVLVHGARIGFFQGDIRSLSDDLCTLKPTVFPVVPRLLNRIHDRIFGQANSAVKRWLLGFAFRRKEAELRRGIVRRNSIWDQMIFRKVQASLGGRVRLIITGAAPISPDVLTFLRVAMGCQFYEGYGQTECTAGCTMTLAGDWTAGHVGPPLPCNAIKLVDVAEMNYLAVNGEGEVCVSGPNVFQGYLHDPEKTAEAIDAHGWLHTGDIGKWLPNGTLKIIDRKKHIFKLAQGEYIAPEKIENIYARSSAVAQIYVHGDSLQAFLVAVVVPDPDFLCGWAKMTLGLQGSYEELCSKEVTLFPFSSLCLFSPPPVLPLLLPPSSLSTENELRQIFRPQLDQLYAGIKL